jgi:murein DD-endopeptidase MepM/ murein hydrolase activator NlpD
MPAPAAPAAPVAPVVRNGGVFPVLGPHSYGDGIGAGRTGHTHQGVDVPAAEGTPLVAPVAGTVRYVDYQAGGAGHYVVVDAADGRSFFFAHIKAGTITVTPGTPLTPGQQFAQVGSTGDSSGPHLHFEIWEGGWRVDRSSHFIDPLPQLKAWDA